MQTERVCESLIENVRDKWINERKQDCDEKQSGKSEKE